MSEPAQRQTVPPKCPACGGGLVDTGWIGTTRLTASTEAQRVYGFDLFKQTVRCLGCDVEWAVGLVGWLEVSGPGKRGSTTRRWLRRERARENVECFREDDMREAALRRPDLMYMLLAPHQDDTAGDETVYATGEPFRGPNWKPPAGGRSMHDMSWDDFRAFGRSPRRG